MSSSALNSELLAPFNKRHSFHSLCQRVTSNQIRGFNEHRPPFTSFPWEVAGFLNCSQLLTELLLALSESARIVASYRLPLMFLWAVSTGWPLIAIDPCQTCLSVRVSCSPHPLPPPSEQLRRRPLIGLSQVAHVHRNTSQGTFRQFVLNSPRLPEPLNFPVNSKTSKEM